MSDKKTQQVDRMVAYQRMLEKHAGKAVRPYRADGYMNLLNRYGTSKDTTEQYKFVPESTIADESLTMFYEGNGLFAKIIDAPAEEAIKHGFTLKDITDDEVEAFYSEALDELDWEEVFMTGIKWARLFGGAIGVMLINDGGALEDPLNWKKIKSIDDIRIYDRSVIQPDYNSMFSYEPDDPFRKRGSRLGMPEHFFVTSRYGNFTVHESRCLTFQNGLLPENSSNSIYQFWGMPEYVRIHRALRDAEIAHGSAPKMLDRSVQAVYKMKDLASLLATEQGESQVLRRLQTIDMARGLLNSITIDNEGEDYDFRQFQFSGVSDVIDSTCNFLSALTNIPQTILFGRSPSGMNATGRSDLENWYNFVQRIQKRMIKSNLRYLLSIIFQAGMATEEVKEIPKIKIEFNPLWSMSDAEMAELENKKAQTAQAKAQTAEIYVNMQAIDPREVRRKLADSNEFDVDTILDEEDLDDDLVGYVEELEAAEHGGKIFSEGDFSEYAEGKEEGTKGSTPTNAPAATKLPEDMTNEELSDVEENTGATQETADDPSDKAEIQANDSHSDSETSNTSEEGKPFSVGVLVISDGKVLSGTRHNDFGYGLVCGPGGHGEKGETPEQAAFRETEEEFGISPKELIPLGRGPVEPDTGLQPYLFLCTSYDGEPNCVDLEMTNATFRTLEELDQLAASMFQPFADGLEILKTCIETALFFGDEEEGVTHEALVKEIGEAVNADGGPGSGNHGHSGVPGTVGGSAPSAKSNRAYSEEYIAKLPEKSKAAIKEYTSYAYSGINSYMRGSVDYLPDSHKEVISDVSTALEGTRIPESITTFRGTDMNELASYAGVTRLSRMERCEELDKLKGKEVDVKSFLSTSEKNPDEIGRNAGVEIIVTTPAGGKALTLGELSKQKGEAEVLLPPSKYKITDVQYTKDPDDNDYITGKVIVRMEQVHSDGHNSDGSSASGNWGHEGVPGKVGGSAPGTGSASHRQGTAETGYTSEAKKRAEKKKMGISEGRDLTRVYRGNKDTKSVLKAQGFTGKPRLATKEEFDAAVEASGFIAQRTYSASTQEILDSYREELYNGDFYVDCTVGGSQYGQGMYCAADYDGKLTDGIKAEMDHYKQIGSERAILEADREFTKTLTKEDFAESYYSRNVNLTDEEFRVYMKLHTDPDMTIRDLSDSERKIIQNIKDRGDYSSLNLSLDDMREQFAENYKTPSYVETLTLTPDAKIIKYADVIDMQQNEGKNFLTKELDDYAASNGKECEAFFRIQTGRPLQDGDFETVMRWSTENPEAFNKAETFRLETIQKSNEVMTNAMRMDVGAYAAMKGYDAINAEYHGESGSYTVVLNRTKTIFLVDDSRKDSDDGSRIIFEAGENGIINAIRDGEIIGWVIASAVNEKDRKNLKNRPI